MVGKSNSKLLSPFGILVFKLTIVMFLYSVCRVLFYAFNARLFPDITLKSFCVIMLGGLRFDLSAVLYINLLFVLLQLIPFKFRHSVNYQRILNFLFYITNAIGLALNCIDIIYYRFTQRRTTLLVLDEFKNEQNYSQLIKHFFLDYYYILLIWILLIAGMVWMSKKVSVKNFKWDNLKYYTSGTLILIILSGLTVVGLRSGLPPKQDFPLAPSDAGQYAAHPDEVAIVQNTPFCMLRTLNKPIYKRENYFPEEVLSTIYSPIHFPDSVKQFKKMNVVVIIVESLGKETLRFYNKDLDNGTYRGYTPFLDSLAEHSMVFMNSFANSRISIEASPSVIASIPSFQESYTLSYYSNNKINSLASCLSKKGYETIYAHGAPNGSLGLNAFAMMAGIEKYIGKDEYNNNIDYDGVWGIWDHKFLPFFARECSKFKQPFQANVFTTSSHHPYKLPAELGGNFPEGTLPIFKSIRYADFSLRAFFKEASKHPWFENTIFVITGDHTCARYHKEYLTSLGAYSVPLIFYTPGGQMELGKDEKVAQQIDVMPTVLNFLGYNEPYFAFGKDLFNDKEDKIAINYIGNAFQLIWDNWVLHYNGTKTMALFDRKVDPLLKNNLVGKNIPRQDLMERKIKAIIQQFNNRMIDNRLLQ